jgi:hypothetical protein
MNNQEACFKMFGVKDINDWYELNNTAYLGTMGPKMLVMAIASDAQEMLAHGDTEGARQLLNRIKWTVSKKIMTEV